MIVSYKWLSEYLPVTIEPEKLSRILTSIGLEVELLYKYEEVKGGLQGLIVGEVIETQKHPNADKLTLTKVDIGNDELLQIVCGAPNVAAGQKVIVAPVGTTIHPIEGEPIKMKVAKIRGVESFGMICAEDEVGLGNSHEGIVVLPQEYSTGTEVKAYYEPYEDWIFELGLTPNRMDAMSHWGIARDVCAWLNHHDKKGTRARIPTIEGFKPDNRYLEIDVVIENTNACRRYSGVTISDVSIQESPLWLQQRLKALGQRPINNIVDITNFIQQETGQPLHAFDADKISGQRIVVKNLPEGTEFITLDEKPRKLSKEDLMICDTRKGLCIAGVFGGTNSGVTAATRNIFLESAWFNPVDIRRTSFRHGLRTDAATRFEKGIDISNTVNVLKRAILMIREIAGGKITSDIVDIYPDPLDKKEVVLKYHYLKKLSGKNYHPDTAREILVSLGFEVKKEGMDELWVAAPYHKPDIELPADVVEEIVRIDGLDNIEIPGHILISPSTEKNIARENYKEKISNWLTGLGFNEIMTNSITNSAYFNEEELAGSVKMINSLSAELNMLRISMLESGLESIAWNLNRKNNDLKFFEFGKSYHSTAVGNYQEHEHLCLYVTGNEAETNWKRKAEKSDFYLLKGIGERIFELLGLRADKSLEFTSQKFEAGLQYTIKGEIILQTGIVHKKLLNTFDIKQPVFYADLNWETLSTLTERNKISFEEIPRFPAVERDISLIVDRKIKYEDVQALIDSLGLTSLVETRLFDIFESEKIGAGKKSMAISFKFLDKEKTLTDKEIDEWMGTIMTALSNKLRADIRKK